MRDPSTFQELILRLQKFWLEQGCVLFQPFDMEVGAGTFHPATFLKAIGPEPWNAAYVQPTRRPTDGRYGDNPNRLQHYFQFQVILKPSPINIQDLYIKSLKQIGINPLQDDIRFVEDNWESPTLGAWGLGWEVWLNGMEITQFTYFQQIGGLPCQPITGELTYGLERLAMAIFQVNDYFHIPWGKMGNKMITYGDIFKRNELEMSIYNFEHANIDYLLQQFTMFENQAKNLITYNLPLPAYEMVVKASHVFNLLDARQAISVTERQRYILKLRDISSLVAKSYYEIRKQLAFPLLKGINA